MLNIAAWAQEYFRKPLSFTTVCCCIKKCNLNLCYSRRKLYISSMQWCHRGSLGQSSSQIVKKTVCCAQMSTHFNLFLGKRTLSSQSQRPKGPSRLSQRHILKQTSVMVWGCSSANGMGDCNMCEEGTIDMEANIIIVHRHILPSRWCISWEVHGY